MAGGAEAAGRALCRSVVRRVLQVLRQPVAPQRGALHAPAVGVWPACLLRALVELAAQGAGVRRVAGGACRVGGCGHGKSLRQGRFVHPEMPFGGRCGQFAWPAHAAPRLPRHPARPAGAYTAYLRRCSIMRQTKGVKMSCMASSILPPGMTMVLARLMWLPSIIESR